MPPSPWIYLGGDPRWTSRWDEWQGSDAQLLAPPAFRHEVANALIRGQRKPAAVAAVLLERLFGSGIDIALALRGLIESGALAERHGLTVYDAAYLQLALDTDGELATLDRALGTAARREGLVVHD